MHAHVFVRSHTLVWTHISMYTHTRAYVCRVHAYTYVHIPTFASENESADACVALIQLEFCVHSCAHVKKWGWIHYKTSLSMQIWSQSPVSLSLASWNIGKASGVVQRPEYQGSSGGILSVNL